MKKAAVKTDTMYLQLAEQLVETMPVVLRMIRHELWGAGDGQLTTPQLRILSHLNRGLNTAVELAAQQGVSLPAISKMVQHLVEKNLVVREYKDGNRKQVFLYLTPRGKATHLKIRHTAQKQISLGLEQMTSSENQAIQLGIQALKTLIEKHKIISSKARR